MERHRIIMIFFLLHHQFNFQVQSSKPNPSRDEKLVFFLHSSTFFVPCGAGGFDYFWKIQNNHKLFHREDYSVRLRDYKEIAQNKIIRLRCRRRRESHNPRVLRGWICCSSKNSRDCRVSSAKPTMQKKRRFLINLCSRCASCCFQVAAFIDRFMVFDIKNMTQIWL